MGWGAIAGAVIGGMMSNQGQSGYSGNSQPFTPYNVYGATGNTIANGNTISSSMSPAWNQTYNGLLSQGNSFMNLGGYAPPTQSQFIKGYTTSPGAPSGPAPSKSDFTKQVFVPGWGGVDRATGKYFNPSRYDTTFDQAAYDKALSAYNASGTQSSPIYDQQAYQDALKNYVSPDQKLYQMMTEQAKPGQDAAYADLESRLQAQGQLGAADGLGNNPEMQSFFTAQNHADIARQIQAMTMAPQILTGYQGLQNGAISAAQNIAGQQANQQQIALGGGQAQGAYANTAANVNMNTTLANNAANAAFWGPIGQAVGRSAGGYVNNGMNTPQYTSPQYSPAYGGYSYGGYNSGFAP